MKGVTKLLAEGKFNELEHVAAVARSSKARFVGGGWKLYTFYMGVGAIPNGGASQADWDSHFASVKNWLSNQQTSITPYVALADFYLEDAWKARGDAYADTVTEEGWRVFDLRVKQARAILEQSRGFKMKCPEWYRVMMSVALDQGWDRSQEKELFEEAIAFEPEYYYFYQDVGWYLMPKWYGEEGDLGAFAQTVADRVGGKDGDILYWQIAVGTVAKAGSNAVGTHLSWIRIRRGYKALVEKYGETLLRQNQMSQMAFKFTDPLLAQELFARIGENWTGNWYSRENFDNAETWAATRAAQMGPIKDIYYEIGDNIATPEGEAYAKLIAQEFLGGYVVSVKRCTALQPPQDGQVNIALKMGQSGTMEQLIVYPETAIGDCLRPKIQDGVFPAPPKPGYWITFTVIPK